jgi:ElaB/YqjD/DUF883 family membrane-anchored ribosome-binding protein
MDNTLRGNNSSNSGFPNGAESNVAKASSSAHGAVDSMADEAARKAKPAIDKVAALAHQAVDKAAGVAEPTAEWLAQQRDSLNATQKKLMDDTCSYVSANPLKAIGIAVVAGFLLSRIVL